jgi:Flp pilus assembly protein TadD
LLTDRKGGSNSVMVMTLQAASHPGSTRRLAPVAIALLIATAAAGCGTIQQALPTVTGANAAPAPTGDPRQVLNAWGERYRANPRDPEAAINYAQSLRATGQRAQAAAVLEQASLHNTGNMELAGAYGRALADVGKLDQALEVLNRAHLPDRPDWRVLNVQGVVLDQLGRHQEAQSYYGTALRIAPDEPAVLSNLGLSYALSKKLPEAEATLKRASAGRSADPRVRQNLALVVGLQGRLPEAEAIASADLPADQAAANVAYLKQMLAQPNALQARAQPKRSPARPAS